MKWMPSSIHLPFFRITLGWLAHFVCLLYAGFYQMDMQVFIDNIFNTPLMWLIHSLQSDITTRYFFLVNHFGSGNVATVLMLVFILVAWLRKDKALASKIFLFALGSALMAGAAKVIVSATRPQLWPSLEHASGSSFPSSHAMASLGLAFIAAWVLHDAKYQLLRYCIFFIAISTGIARIYIGVHRPSDILLSWLIVISWQYWMASCYLQPDPEKTKVA